MPEGAGTGIGIGIGEGLKSIGESLTRKWMLEHAEREKRADAYEEQARAIAHNISVAGGKDNPATADMQTQLQDVISKHNALYQPHETPALLARVQRFMGKTPAPPRPDERASMTPESILAQTPAQKKEPYGPAYSYGDKTYQRLINPFTGTFDTIEVPGPTENQLAADKIKGTLERAKNLLPPDTYEKIRPTIESLQFLPYQLLENRQSTSETEAEFQDFLKHPDLVKQYGGDRLGFQKYKAEQKPKNMSNYRADTITLPGEKKPIDVLQDMDPDSKTVGHYFRPTANGLVDITGQQGHYEKPSQAGVNFSLNNPSAPEQTVKYIAEQVRANPLNWNLTAGNKVLQNQVRDELTKGEDVNRLSQSTRQLGETADAIVPKIDDTIKKLANPKFVQNLGPFMGRWNEFLTGAVGTNDPELAQLRSTLSLLQTGTMRAHVGARGSEGLLNKFEGLVDGSKMDADTLKGSLTGIRDFLQGYRDIIHKGKSGSGNVIIVSPEDLR